MADDSEHDDRATPFTTRVVNFRERARQSWIPKEPKSPPPPGEIPDCGDVDPDRVLNRDE